MGRNFTPEQRAQQARQRAAEKSAEQLRAQTHKARLANAERRIDRAIAKRYPHAKGCLTLDMQGGNHCECGATDARRRHKGRMSDIKPDLLRIRSNPTHDKRAKGQDTVVEVVHPDGTAVPLPNVQAVYFYVDGRRDYATAVIVAHVRADITAPRGDSSLMMEMAKLAGEMAAKDALIADLKLQLQDSLGVELTGAD